jgi:hypothetical protein
MADEGTQAESYTEETFGDNVSNPLPTKFWGRLVSHCGLRHSALPLKTEGDLPNLFLIGRNLSCDLVIDDDKRISGNHCRLYCQINSLSKEPDFFLENLSGNGTFVRTVAHPDQDILLTGNTRRRLSSGDMIVLLCARKVSSNELLNRVTFTFLKEVGASGGVAAVRDAAHVSVAPLAELGRSFTQKLTSRLPISEFYDLQRTIELGR